MECLKTKVAMGIANLTLAAVPLTPALVVLNGMSPYRLPWVYMFIPWLGAFHLVLCWVFGQMVARVLSDVVDGWKSR